MSVVTQNIINPFEDSYRLDRETSLLFQHPPTHVTRFLSLHDRVNIYFVFFVYEIEERLRST